jgi:murein DD-endopeptidase MepM/ murein hydrolase activator NlpD
VHKSLVAGRTFRLGNRLASPLEPQGVSTPASTLSQSLIPTVRWPAGYGRHWFAARWTDDLFRSRTAAHTAVILLLALVAVLGKASLFRLPSQEEYAGALPGYSPGQASQAARPPDVTQNATAMLPAASLADDGNVVMPAAVPYTIIPERPRQEITQYVVRSGDTIFGIAAQFGLEPETVMWANGRFVEDNPDLLRVGQELTILPVDGVYHQVGRGDTIAKIAGTFKADPAAIIDFPLNNLDPENPEIHVGQYLIVPGGTKPYVPRQVAAYNGPVPKEASKGSGMFAWPATGQISQAYWSRHRALDISTWLGAPVLAADSGFVVAAGWDDSGFGRMVVIDHGNGFQTLYAHLRVFYVKVGQSIGKGEQLGEVGTTGNATGPHLHFEVHQSGAQRNPAGFLP